MLNVESVDIINRNSIYKAVQIEFTTESGDHALIIVLSDTEAQSLAQMINDRLNTGKNRNILDNFRY